MKKLLSIVLCLAMLFSVVCIAVACEKTNYEIAVVTDVGQLKDGGFNQGTWEGAEAFAKANKKTYQYYQPANGADATDNDRIAAMRQAIKNGAKVIVAPGYLQATAMSTVAKESPDVKFIFIDGWALGLDNVTAVVYKEQESGFMAGYATVMEGYTKLGGTFGGGGTNPACNRFGYGFVQGAAAAAEIKNVDVSIKYSYQHGDGFSASPELKNQISTWYQAGTEVVFACGGSMFASVKAAAEETTNGKIVGVDVDQAPLSDRVITSAVKGLAESVQKILGQFYDGEWDTKLKNQASNLGASDNATGLPTANWRFKNYTKADYEALFKKIADGTITIKSDTPENCKNADWLTTATEGTRVTVQYE